MGDDSFWGVFQDQGSFPLSHPFGYSYFSSASISLKCLSVMDGCGIFKLESMYAIMAWHFPIFWMSLSDSRHMSVSCLSLNPCNSFSMLFIYPFSFSVMFFLFPYSTPKLFGFLCIHLLVCPCAFPNYLLVEFSFVILKCHVLFCFVLFLLYCLTLSLYLLSLLSFTKIFWFISSSCQICLLFYFGFFISTFLL